jgi:ABC-type multidrug transport system ATPase subunit
MNGMTKTLEVKGLTKKFGKLTAVNNLNLTIEQGQVFGILGPNGSGKTTTLGMLLDVISPTAGEYAWFGGIKPSDARKQIGSILETPSFYPYLTAVQNLRIVTHIKKTDEEKIDHILEQVGLHERRNDKFKSYSLGMKQRLSIGAALVSDPPVLILDEPTNGLDPEGIAEVRELISSIAEQGKTILLASHLLDEVQKVCTHFCVLRKGVKLHEGAVADILGETNRVEVKSHDMEKLQGTMAGFPGLQNQSVQNGRLAINLKPEYTATDVNKYCFENEVTLHELIPIKNSLEQEFLKILKEND